MKEEAKKNLTKILKNENLQLLKQNEELKKLLKQSNNSNSGDTDDDDDDDSEVDNETDISTELMNRANINLFRTDKNVNTFERIYNKSYTQLQTNKNKIDYLRTVLSILIY